MWGLIWKEIGLFIILSIATGQANTDFREKAMGSFVVWLVVMFVMMAGMYFLAA